MSDPTHTVPLSSVMAEAAKRDAPPAELCWAWFDGWRCVRSADDHEHGDQPLPTLLRSGVRHWDGGPSPYPVMCAGNLHAECPCAEWMRQGTLPATRYRQALAAAEPFEVAAPRAEGLGELVEFYHWLHKDEPGNELTEHECKDVDRCYAEAFLSGAMVPPADG